MIQYKIIISKEAFLYFGIAHISVSLLLLQI